MGKFIVIDGLDASGKETQSKILADELEAEGKKVRLLSFPRYDSEGCALVKLYLSGKLGEDPKDTGAYAASSFYAMDRYVSYRTEWRGDFEDPDTIIIANRYTTANAVHQLSKLERDKWDEFLEWLWDFEYVKLGIPKPDVIIYLEMTPEISMRLINSRSADTGREKDIHEKDPSHLRSSYEAAMYASEKLGWNKIKCHADGEPRKIDEIAKEILEIVKRA